jgi:hypothetical protein
VVANVEVPVATRDPVVVLLVRVALVVASVVAVRLVAVVVASTVLPDTVRADDDALPSVVCPLAVSAPVKVAVLPKRELVIVRADVEALASVVCPDTERDVAVSAPRRELVA